MTVDEAISVLEHSAEGKNCPGVLTVLKAMAGVPAGPVPKKK